MLNNKHKNDAIDSMYKNKSLMNELEKEYKIVKEVGTVASSLNDKVGLRVMYEEAFTPKKGSITDPITGKENEAPQFGPVRK